jgi:mono/diheme cytochrome c family protein
MKRAELFSRIAIGLAVLAAIGLPLIAWMRTPLIHARISEAGGWSPDLIHAQAGVPLLLHLTSDDVVHGFGVGQMDLSNVDVLPGEVTDLTLTFARPGTYTFYCTRWCGLNHWRMRGTIEVSGAGPVPAPAPAPEYVILGLDLDAPHEAPVIPAARPSALRGGTGPSEFTSPEFYRAHSPYEAWLELRANPALSDRTDAQLWDMVAFIWKSNTSAEGLERGGGLYARNCAACHGEGGAGDGVYADDLMLAGGMIQSPADFTDPARMLGASPALLQGKILRGGMGTGMPSWGPVFTEGQTWDLVAYLYSFQFDYFK